MVTISLLYPSLPPDYRLDVGDAARRALTRFVGRRSYLYNWTSLFGLSFKEALLMRLAYIVSYVVLFLYETAAIIAWIRQLPAPPRSVLVVAASVLLTLTYGISSWPGISWSWADRALY